ncbi:hypothetical protein C8Q76DRAFT_215066 [Earliella scabrosa]|nr:hypothetical protein C8Q76DRAFT_215066 [Earliella scabrosa]
MAASQSVLSLSVHSTRPPDQHAQTRGLSQIDALAPRLPTDIGLRTHARYSRIVGVGGCTGDVIPSRNGEQVTFPPRSDSAPDNSIDHLPIPRVHQTFPRLVTLVLSHVVFPNFATFRRFLCALPALTDLTLWNIDWTSRVPYGAMVQFMGNVPCVTRLSLAFFSTDESKAALLRMLSHCLEEMTVYSPPRQRDWLPAFEYTSLRSLTLDIFNLHDVEPSSDFFPGTATLPKLRSIHFVDVKTYPEATAVPEFRVDTFPIATAIMNAHLPALERVVLVYGLRGTRLDFDTVAPKILAKSREQFIELHKRGQLIPIVATYDDRTPANCSRFWYDTPEAIQRVQYPGIAIMDAIQRFLERY